MISFSESNNIYEIKDYFLINKKYISNINGEYSSKYNLLKKEDLKTIINKLLFNKD